MNYPGILMLFLAFFMVMMAFCKKMVYMDIVFKDKHGKPAERKIIIELYDDKVKNTVNNFYQILKGVKVKGKHCTYEGSIFHRIIPGFMIQGGDIMNKDGTGSISIFNGRKFPDENFDIKHSKGCLSMANSGPDTNGSQFFITVAETDWLNGNHVVFGHVTPESLVHIEEISNVETNPRSATPLSPVKIIKCGDYHEEKEGKKSEL